MSAHDSDRSRKGARMQPSDDEPTLLGDEKQSELSQDDVVLIVDRAVIDEDSDG
jgi:hypothetical protein